MRWWVMATTVVGGPVSAVQRRVGQALRSRVAGADAEVRARRIWGTPGPRWFTPADPIWRVHEDASMFPGGIAALLLQSLHPLAMAGVAGHSGFKGDPWGRLQRTSTFLAVTTYGTIDHAEEAIAAVRAIHERVRGKDHRGRPYRASDPELLRWVHVAESYSFLTAYQRFGAAPLSAADADTYVRQSGTAAALLGATDLPTTVAELHRRLEDYRPRLEVTPAARDAARLLLFDPPLPWVARPGYATLAAGGVAILPDWARRQLRLPSSGSFARGARAAGALGTRAVRWGMAGVERRSALAVTSQ